MPLTMAEIGVIRLIKKVNGKDDTKQFLKNLGFLEGSEITVISRIQGNIIVKTKETRVAISKSIASKIIVQ